MAGELKAHRSTSHTTVRTDLVYGGSLHISANALFTAYTFVLVYKWLALSIQYVLEQCNVHPFIVS